jgi:hypothetical protein
MDGAPETPDIDYPRLMRGALAGVVRTVLARVAEEGLPGDHHFFLTFGPADEGVEVPAVLRKQFPEEVTIVLQHQFWNLAVDDAGFAVTLRFGGKPERIVVPWAALRAFVDPSVEFGFRLQPAASPVESAAEEAAAGKAAPDPAGDGKVVAFRKKPE